MSAYSAFDWMFLTNLYYGDTSISYFITLMYYVKHIAILLHNIGPSPYQRLLLMTV